MKSQFFIKTYVYTERILEATERNIRMKIEFLRKHPYIEETHRAGLTHVVRKTIIGITYCL